MKDQSSFSETKNQNGNWVSAAVPGQTYRNTYTYGGTQPHAPSRIATQGGLTIDYQYDASGNHTQRTSSAGTRNATWTDDDKLRSMKRVADSYDLIRNYYDGSGQKAIAVHPGATSTEEVAFHRGDLTVRVNGDNQYVTKHIYAGGERLASKMDAAWFSARPIQYAVSDHLGSAHYTLDGRQNLISHTEFFPSGELWIDQLNQNYTQTPRWSFTGKEWDADTGLYDFGARQYDPRVGQWLSPDPILASYMQGGPNGGVYYPINLGLYSYVANNPVKYVDGNGEFFWMPVIVGGFVGAAIGLVTGLTAPRSNFRSTTASVLSGAVGGALAGLPFGGAFVASRAALAVYGGLVVAPTSWATRAAVDPASANLTSLGVGMAVGGFAPGLTRGAVEAMGRAAALSSIPNAVIRDGILTPGVQGSLAGTMTATYAAERGTSTALSAGMRAAGQAAAVAAAQVMAPSAPSMPPTGGTVPGVPDGSNLGDSRSGTQGESTPGGRSPGGASLPDYMKGAEWPKIWAPDAKRN